MGKIMAAVNPEMAGRLTGQLLVLLLLVWGIWKCWSISRRPTTNAKCVLALMLLLIGWLCAGCATVLVSFEIGNRIAVGFLRLGMAGLFIGAVILAIIGLVEYGRFRERYVQGRAQAIWVLALFCVFLVFGIIAASLSGSRSAATRDQPSVGTPLTFQDLNFQFVAPGKPWVKMDASKVNPSAKLGFLMGNPEMYFVVSAEPVEQSWSTDNLVDFTLERIRGLSESSQVQSRTPWRLGGLEGRRVELQAKLRGYELQYLNWFCVTNGWAYQLMAYGRVASRPAIMTHGERLFQNFSVLDYQRSPPLAGRATVSDFTSTNFGYRVRCGAPGWMDWATMDRDCELASFGVLHRNDGALAVGAVWLMDLSPRPEAIHQGLLATLAGEATAGALSRARPIQEQGLTGIITTFNRVLSNGREFNYQVKILHGGGFAYTVLAWIDAAQKDKERWLSENSLLVDFFPPAGGKPDPASWDERTKRVHRLALNSIGMHSFREGGYAEAARYFERATELGGAPASAPYLGNLVESLSSAGKYPEALAKLEAYPEIVKLQPTLQAQRAFLQGRLGQTTTAITNYADLFATGYSAEDHFREYIGLLSLTDQSDRALAEVEAFLKRQDVPGVRLLQSGLLKQRKKFDEAIAMLKVQREKAPFHAGLAYALGDAYVQAGQPTEALALSQEMIKQQGNSYAMDYLKGRAEFALKWYREAKESFERAHKEAPSDPDVKAFLDTVSAVLGEGASAVVKEPIAAVELPPELGTLTSSPPAEFGRDEGAFYAQCTRAIAFERGKELKTTDYMKVKTLTAAGVSAFSTFQIGFNPLAEEIFVNRLEVRDAGGALVSTGRVADSYVLDDRTSPYAVSRKVLNLPVSGLQPGCSVELVLTRRELGLFKEFSYLPHAFSRTVPVQEGILYFQGDTNAVRFASSPHVQSERFGKGLLWRIKNPPILRWEPLQPQTADYVPFVWIGDSTAAWASLTTNYLSEIRDRMVLSESQRTLARAITANATNLDQKISAIAAHVQSNYTYKAIEFGRRARVPQSLFDIVRNKYGDCKDHAVLAQQMLKAVDVPASLALVNSSSQIRADLPSLDQFDHMIVHVPTPAGNRFLDCTAKSTDLSAPWTIGLAGREALVLDVADPRFVKIPAYPTNASIIRVVRSIELTNQADAFVNEEIQFKGVHAGYFRDYLRSMPVDARRTYFGSQIVGNGGLLADLVIDGLEQADVPLVVRMSYLMRNQFQMSENRMVCAPPVSVERAMLIQEPVSKRVLPYEVTVPLTIEGVVTLKTPPRFKSVTTDIPMASMRNDFISCRRNSTRTADGWKLDYELFEPARRRPAEEYRDHCRYVQQAVDLLRPELVADQKR